MRNLLKDLRYAQFNSAFLRRLLSHYFKENRVYRIPWGPLRGARMHYDRTVNYHTILGLWELENFHFLKRLFIQGKLLHPGMVVCDLGANIGAFSLWFSRKVEGGGRVYAFEPGAPVREMLEKNLALNRADNVQVVAKACSDQTGKVKFYVADDPLVSSLYENWTANWGIPSREVWVEATTLDDYFYGPQRREGPDFIKMDIEGGGVVALRGCDVCVERSRPVFLVESHFPPEDEAISALLVRHGYQAYRINNARWVKKTGEIFPDPEGVWGKLILCPPEKRDTLTRVLP